MRLAMMLVLGCGFAALGCGEAGYEEELGTITDEIATVDHRALGAASWGPGRVDIVGRNTVNQAVHQAFTSPGPWTGYASRGGDLRGTPGVASWGVNRVDIVSRTGSNGIMHKFWNGGPAWSEWSGVPSDVSMGLMSESPALVSWGANHLALFVRGALGDDNIYHSKYVNNQWTSFENLGGDTVGSPAAASTASNRLDLVVRGNNNHLWHRRFNGATFTAFQDVGGDIRESPGIVKSGSDKVAVVARGANGSPWIVSATGGTFGGWQDLVLSGATGSPAVVSRAANSVDVITCRNDNQVWIRHYHEVTGWANWNFIPNAPCQGSPTAVVSNAKSGGGWGAYHVFIRHAVTGKTMTKIVTNPAAAQSDMVAIE